MTDSDEAQEGPAPEPWSEERRLAWNQGYLAGLNDATMYVGTALRDAIRDKRERMAAIHD